MPCLRWFFFHHAVARLPELLFASLYLCRYVPRTKRSIRCPVMDLTIIVKPGIYGVHFMLQVCVMRASVVCIDFSCSGHL